MAKEIIICIVIVVTIVIGNIITQNYTIESIAEIKDELNNLREETIKEEANQEVAIEKFDYTYSRWKDRNEKLSFYIEHDELEKVETNLNSMQGYIDKEEYGDAVSDIDKTIYILEHIKNKTVINLKNIF